MRFVRVYTRTDTGEIVNITEGERPFPTSMRVKAYEADERGELREIEIEMHELGLSARFFNPTTLDGQACAISEHLRLRLERHPDAADHAAENLDRPGASHFRVRSGHEHEVPDFIDMPTTLEGIRARVRDRGVAGGLKAKARAWLAYILEPHEAEALGVATGIPLSVMKAIDTMRTARESKLGGRRVVMERAAQRRSDERRQAIEAANRHREEREAERLAAAKQREQRK